MHAVAGEVAVVAEVDAGCCACGEGCWCCEGGCGEG
jgi:hypothetical protein